MSVTSFKIKNSKWYSFFFFFFFLYPSKWYSGWHKWEKWVSTTRQIYPHYGSKYRTLSTRVFSVRYSNGLTNQIINDFVHFYLWGTALETGGFPRPSYPTPKPLTPKQQPPPAILDPQPGPLNHWGFWLDSGQIFLENSYSRQVSLHTGRN